jgi:hypothetical protein
MAYSAFSILFLNIFIARDAGFFRKHSLDVELIQMAGPLPIAARIAGDVDYLTGITIGLVAAGQGVPLRGIMVTLRKPPFYLVSEPTIQKPEDLSGKRIGVDRIARLQHLVARLILKGRGKGGFHANRLSIEYHDQPGAGCNFGSGAVWSSQRHHGPKMISRNRIGGRAPGALSNQRIGCSREPPQVGGSSHQERDSRYDRNHRLHPQRKGMDGRLHSRQMEDRY